VADEKGKGGIEISRSFQRGGGVHNTLGQKKAQIQEEQRK